MKAYRPPLMRYYLPLLSCCFCWAVASAQNNGSSTPPNVMEAIAICREKLEEDPHFPRIQQSLAKLLESTISPSDSDVDTELVSEVLQLYHAVGQPDESEVEEKRLPPAKVRFESLTRAATIAKDIIHDTNQSIKYLTLAIQLDGVEESAIMLAFETVMPMLLTTITVDQQSLGVAIDGMMNGEDDSADNQQAQLALNLCSIVEAKSATSTTIVDEYRGAALRRMKQPDLAYQSYIQAVVKAKKNMSPDKYGHAGQINNEYINLVANLMRTSVLAAASGREAGETFDNQMTYLKYAEQVAVPMMDAIGENESIEEGVKALFRDQLVDLYNNMGIAEKKQGSWKRAREFFHLALDIEPKDGHALVQLASLEDGNADDVVVSSVKELDPEYVSALFDGYSSRFESELVNVLQYQGHSLVYDAFVKVLKQQGTSPLSIKKVVDLGCGTGLLGEIISNEMPWVKVSGVDLSQRMVDISRERKSKRGTSVYKSVSNEDAATFLSGLEKESIDTILASDVFIYIGDISKVLEESFRCLVKDACVGFTVESYEGATTTDNGLRLLPSGRFGHSKSHIKEVAERNGFEVVSWEDCVLRQQAHRDVRGAAVILRKVR